MKNFTITDLKKAITQDAIVLSNLKDDLMDKMIFYESIKNPNKMNKIILNLVVSDYEIVNHLLHFDFDFIKKYTLKLTTHTGKMSGIKSLSTYKYLNTLCINNSKFENSICAKCYADRNLKMYPQLKYSLIFNTLLLKYTNVDICQMPNINNFKFFRFEAFADVQNEIHLNNLIKIVKAYTSVNFGLWSKNYKVVGDYIRNNKVPANLNVILSSLIINKNCVDNVRSDLIATANIKPNSIKTFTVYDYDNHINCGGLSCLSCLKCYTKNHVSEIREKLK